MEKLKSLAAGLDTDKLGQIQSILAGASILYMGLKHMKESPKLSIAKSLLGGYLIYTALTGKHLFNEEVENLLAKA